MGYSNDGRSLVASGLANIFLQIGGGSPEAHYACTDLVVTADKPDLVAEASYRFAINNLRFGQRYAPWNRQFALELSTANVGVKAAQHYEEQSLRLRKQSGIAPTAWCDVRQA